ATHNAHTIAWVSAYAAGRGVGDFEFQRLHGMGEALYRHVLGRGGDASLACRVYAPVGSHRDLLPYLVRRLLENGANTSFVNRIADPQVEIDDVVADPLARARSWDYAPAARIPLPADLFAPQRRNSAGVSLADQNAMASFDDAIARNNDTQWIAMPMFADANVSGIARDAFEPADLRRKLGTVIDTDGPTADRALRTLVAGQPAWDARQGRLRAAILDRAADALESDRALFVG